MFHDIRLIIYDFDGTMADSRGVIVQALRLTLGAMGMAPQSDNTLARLIGLPLARCFQALEPMSETQAEACADCYRALFPSVNRPGAVGLFPGVEETLRHFHALGLMQTIASNRSHETLAEYVVGLKLSPYISYVLGADDVERPKPDACPVKKTMRALGLTPAQTLVVGDAPVDILMGRAAGAHTCAVTYGNASPSELSAAQPEALISSFHELIPLIRL